MLPANQFAWYVYQRCSTQWERSQFDGSKLGLKYDSVFPFLIEGGYKGQEFFDQMERIQLIELEILGMEAKAREQERAREEARKKLEKSRGRTTSSWADDSAEREDLPRRPNSQIG